MPPESVPDLRALLSDGTVLAGSIDETARGPARALCRRGAVRPAHRVVDDRLEHAPVRRRAPRSRSCSTARSSWQVACDCNGDGVVCFDTARRSCTSLPACRCRRCRPSRARPRRSSRARPRSRPGPAAPAGGRSRSAERAVLDRHRRKQELRARDDVRGRGGRGAFRLVGSATPNVVPAGVTMKVTFLFPAKGVPDDGWISVNPRLDDGADVGSVGADNIGMPGKIRITAEGDAGWAGP